VKIANHRFEVQAGEAGSRLDQYLASRLPGLSRARIQVLVKSGHATVNGSPPKSSAKVRVGDVIELTEPAAVPAEVTAQDIPLSILYEDGDLIVIDKPTGLVVHPAAGHRDDTLVNALLHHCTNLSGVGGVERPGIVHRLDKETSGCLVAAKNDLTHRSLVRQFAGREVTKVYLAMAAGKFRKPSGEVDEPIGRHPVHRQKMAVIGRGRPARTGWRVLGEYPWGSLVECTLHTGRTHQIRVHLKHLGHPVLGDEIYGKRGKFQRQMLHAWRLGFSHPRSGERVTFESPIPRDFCEAGIPSSLP